MCVQANDITNGIAAVGSYQDCNRSANATEPGIDKLAGRRIFVQSQKVVCTRHKRSHRVCFANLEISSSRRGPCDPRSRIELQQRLQGVSESCPTWARTRRPCCSAASKIFGIVR